MERYVPEQKGLEEAWTAALFDRGERRIYRGAELESIGMPCGGICAGQVYVRGDGTLAIWWLGQQHVFTGHGEARTECVDGTEIPVGYQPRPFRPPSPIDQGFTIGVQESGGTPMRRALDRDGFDDIGFIGEYPVATVLYQTRSKSGFPVDVRAEVFSPFIPLDARSSATPATIFHFSVRNHTSGTVSVRLAGRLQRFGDVRLACHHPAAVRMQTDDGLPDESAGYSEGGAPTSDERHGEPDARSGGAYDVVTVPFDLAAGETEEVVFFITWYFPDRINDFPGAGGRVGNMYESWYGSALDVERYLARNYERLRRETFLFRDTYFDTTLPYWFIQRIGMPLANLATETFQWWKDGRFWAFEGVGCCFGTCGHVYNYAQAIAHLFPELERSVRLQQDMAHGLDPSSGRVGFRGVRGNNDKVGAESWGYATDAQCGYVLKFYREHLLSNDGSFLERVWPMVRLMIEYLIARDADGDGVLVDRQHTTWDSDLYGPNGYIGSLYIAALRVAEAMARLQGDEATAARYGALAESGREIVLTLLWNAEYFVHLSPPETENLPMCIQYGSGCLSDQLFGSGWAEELGLGPLYPTEHTRATLQSIFRYNWTPDVAYNPAYPSVGPRHKEVPKIRPFALPGEAGLFVATWPHGGEPPNPIYHNAEVFTGTEYQVSAHMIREGLLEEGFTIIRGLHDRYDPARRNPWNEIECGDHYGRSLASWSCLLAASGWSYDGPAGRIGFAPRVSPEDFRAFFSAAEGWGRLEQHRHGRVQSNTIDLRWGKLRLRTVAVQVPEGVAPVDLSVRSTSGIIEADTSNDREEIVLRFRDEQILVAPEQLRIEVVW